MTETEQDIAEKSLGRKMKGWHEKTSAAPLVIYRIGFGLLMFLSALRFVSNGWVKTQYIDPTFHFSYYGFDWLPYPSNEGIYVLFALMLISSVFIMLGLFYRFATVLFFLAFTYIELLDKTNYLNHYYFVSLISFLLIFIPANRYFSLDAKFGFVQQSGSCSKWNIRILQFQIAIVYIFAGIAKLESDWLLNAQPLKYWLHTAHHYKSIGPLLKQGWIAHAFAWSACIYDLTIVLFLFLPKTRQIAYLFVILFHLTTWLLFPIGVFPWVMMVATLIFFSPNFHERILNFLRLFWGYHAPKKQQSMSTMAKRKVLTTTFLVIYMLVQLSIPLRYLGYDGNIFWTEHGYRFSWRVMLMEKSGEATFFIKNPTSGIKLEINNSTYLTPNQEKMMSTQPDMILEFAHFLESEYEDTIVTKHGVEMNFIEPQVHAEVFVSLNSRPHQLYVDAKYNLASIDNNLKQRKWLEDFNE